MAESGRGDHGDGARTIERPPDFDAMAPGRIHRLWRSVAQIADGTTVGLPIVVVAGRVTRPRVVVVGGVHGDEHEGPAALVEIVQTIQPAALDGTLVAVPVANPPAFRANARRNPLDAQDFNRIVPGDPQGSLTLRLAHHLVEEVVRGADALVTIHGWTTGWLTVPYVEYTAGATTTEASRRIAAAFGLEFLEPLPLQPGRLLSHATTLGIPAVEAEIGGEGVTLEARAALGVRGVEGVLRELGLLAGTPARPARQRDVARSELRAPEGGMFRRAPGVSVGASVVAGQRLGTIADLVGLARSEVVAPADGILAVLRHALPVEPGDLVAAVFGDRTEGASTPGQPASTRAEG